MMYVYLQQKNKRKEYKIGMTEENNPNIMKLIRKKKICYYSRMSNKNYIELMKDLKNRFIFQSSIEFTGKESVILGVISCY